MAMKRGSVVMPDQLKSSIERLSHFTGLSCDGITDILCDYINEACNEIATIEFPFSKEGKSQVKSIVNGRFTRENPS